MTISGPYVTSRPWPRSSETYYQEKWKYKGKSPRPPLPYVVGRATGNGAWNVLNAENMTSLGAAEAVEKLQTRCYDKFWGLALERASLGISLVEGRQSYQMVLSLINNKFVKLVIALRSLKRLDFEGVNHALGVDTRFRPRYIRGKPRSQLRDRTRPHLENLWMEYTFGWKPLIQDVYGLLKVFQQDFGSFNHKVRVRDVKIFDHPWDGGTTYGGTVELVYYYGSKIRITNPNLLLAKQLGLTNPAEVLWDAVAFSFVVDWFVPVGKYLRSLTNQQGLELVDPYHGHGAKLTGYSRHIAHPDVPIHRVTGLSGGRITAAIPVPGLSSRIHLPKMDPWLAVTSLSLLLQQFSAIRVTKRS